VHAAYGHGKRYRQYKKILKKPTEILKLV